MGGMEIGLFLMNFLLYWSNCNVQDGLFPLPEVNMMYILKNISFIEEEI